MIFEPSLLGRKFLFKYAKIMTFSYPARTYIVNVLIGSADNQCFYCVTFFLPLYIVFCFSLFLGR